MEYFITETDHNKRIDVYVQTLDIGLSRASAQKLITSGHILVNSLPIKLSRKVKIGDKVTVDIPKPIEMSTDAENIPINVIFEDKDIIVVNKARGMVVHPAVGNTSKTLVNALLHHCKNLSGISGVLRPGIVHRLDKDTSGAMVVAKSDKAHKALSKQFKNHTVTKIYFALVAGVVKDDKGKISESIGRHPVNRKKMSVIKDHNLKSREAHTEYEVVKRFKDATLLKIKLGTGRTHQIRVHLSYIGHPIIGDPVYGKVQGKAQLLHSKTLGFIHPKTGKYVEFDTELPQDMKDAIAKLEDNEGS